MICLALSTFGTEADAERVARSLVQEKLAACATRWLGARSIYCWQGELEESEETVVIFKVPEAILGRFVSRLQELHPYEVPEVLWWKADGASEPYQRWVAEVCGLGNSSVP